MRGVEDPDKDVPLFRRCMGNPQRDTRIYGAYSKTVIASPFVPALPASCLLPASVIQAAVLEDNSVAEGSVYGAFVRAGSRFRPTTCNVGEVVEGSIEAHSRFVR